MTTKKKFLCLLLFIIFDSYIIHYACYTNYQYLRTVMNTFLARYNSDVIIIILYRLRKRKKKGKIKKWIRTSWSRIKPTICERSLFFDVCECVCVFYYKHELLGLITTTKIR